ncbi:hypothetical protein [Escherichia coli]|uniref:hypothetical protein n=1 Tax=Escherichia coli TaxID=562 RepID=UPI001F4AA3BB|nr:hypothetical protein [Escherichia coli]
MTTHKIVKSWTTEAGLPAVVLLVNDGSHHCGYVVVPDNLVDKDSFDYDMENYTNICVHGGVTYLGVLPQLEDKIAIGFDCAHYGDLMKCPDKYKGTPLEGLRMYTYGEWRDEQYCTDECESMAKQLMAMLPKQLEG